MLATKPRRPQAVRQRPERRLRSLRRFIIIAVLLLLAAMFLLAKPVGAYSLADASAALTEVRAPGGSTGGSLPPTSL